MGPSLVGPATVAIGQNYQVAGSGYDPSRHVWLQITTDDCSGQITPVLDAKGNLTVNFTAIVPGNCVVSAGYVGDTNPLATTTTTITQT